MGICGLCGKKATWKCRTCGESYCSDHWHETSKGKNVECSGCEMRRNEKAGFGTGLNLL